MVCHCIVNHIIYLLCYLGLYNIKQRYAYSLGCLTFKCLHNLAPDGPVVLSDLLHKLSDVKEHPCRRNTQYNLIVPRTRTCKLNEAFFVSAPLAWNSLPLTLKMADSLACFKCHYKAFLTMKL